MIEMKIRLLNVAEHVRRVNGSLDSYASPFDLSKASRYLSGMATARRVSRFIATWTCVERAQATASLMRLTLY